MQKTWVFQILYFHSKNIQDCHAGNQDTGSVNSDFLFFFIMEFKAKSGLFHNQFNCLFRTLTVPAALSRCSWQNLNP